MIPPIYILATLAFSDLQSRAKAFGVISGMGGIGAAAGPLIGGLITTTISWRASFLLQAAVVATIIYLSRKITDPLPADPTRPFDGVGAALSAAGMSFLVIGILQAGNNNTLLVIFLALGAAFLLWFFLHIRSSERAGKGAVAVHEPVSQPHVQPRARHPEHPMAAADGDHVRRLSVPADRARVQRDQDRRHLHRGNRRDPRSPPFPRSDSPRSTRNGP